MTKDDELDRRIDAFWVWFAGNSAKLRTMARIDQSEPDAVALNAVASEIYPWIADISPDLFVDVLVAPTELILVVRSESEDQTNVDGILARAPVCTGWRLSGESPRDLESIITRDESGRQIVIRYADLRFLIMKRPTDGRNVVLVVWNGDFDSNGPECHLYDGVAQHVTTTLLGPRASSRCPSAMAPARMATGVTTRPILELRDAWTEAVRQG